MGKKGNKERRMGARKGVGKIKEDENPLCRIIKDESTKNEEPQMEINLNDESSDEFWCYQICSWDEDRSV